MTSKNRITINLTESEYAALGELAAESKVSKAWIGRHAISSLLEKARSRNDNTPLPFVELKRENVR